MQRLRVRFSRGEEVRFISHLDVMRLWQRAIHRTGIPLAYSEGYNPRPRISLAAPLAVGVTSEAELMDVFCTRWISPHFFTAAVSQQLPPGIAMRQILPVALTLPSLQAQLRQAEYSVTVETDAGEKEIETKLTALLALETLPWQHQRDTGVRQYDLRALISDLWLIDCQPPYCTIGMRLRCDSGGSGRPEQVIIALGFTAHPQSMHRTQLILETN